MPNLRLKMIERNVSGLVMPIGIPTPPFGLEETAPPLPDPWTTDVPGFYYVDFQTGTDTGRTYGNPTASRKTIPNTIPAGSVVTLATGSDYTKQHTSPQYITAQGTAAEPVFIRGISAASKPTMRIQQEFEDTSYLIVENIAFYHLAGGYSQGIRFKTGNLGITPHHNCVRHCELSGSTTLGSALIGITNGNYTVIYDCYLHDNGDLSSTFDQDAHGINVGTGPFWALSNEFTRCNGDGVQMGSNSGGPSYCYLGGNVSHGNRQSGLFNKVSHHVIYSQNTIYDHLEYPLPWGGGADGIGIHYACEYTWALFNRCYNNMKGFSLAGDRKTNIYLIGNLIHDNTSSGIVSTYAATPCHIVNNTFYNNPTHVNQGAATFVAMAANNIFAGARNYDIYVTANQGSWDARRCLFPSPALIRWGASTYDVAGLQGQGDGLGCLEGAPDFVDPANPDLSLRDFDILSTSDAVDQAALESVYQTYSDLYGIDISKDFAKRLRPQGLNWDMGAYEYGS